MCPVPDRSTFESAYAGQAPWDIGRPQKALMAVADRIAGSVLDAGCGTGENALYFAGRGCTVTGIDLLVPDVTGTEYAFVEANERPGLANHEPQPTAAAFVDYLFPGRPGQPPAWTPQESVLSDTN